VGLAYFGLYYGLFRLFIVRFDLKTPGRDDAPAVDPSAIAPAPLGRQRGFIEALGGAANLVSVDACTTRLRLIVADHSRIDEPALRALGALGLVRPSARDLQVVVGPIADEIAREIRQELSETAKPTQAMARVIEAPSLAAPPPAAAELELSAALIGALGGSGNVTTIETRSTRLRVQVAQGGAVDEKALRALAVRGLAQPAPSIFHILIGERATALAEALVLGCGQTLASS
jgi:PTS system N-acetylglucosamine-specific IIC component